MILLLIFWILVITRKYYKVRMASIEHNLKISVDTYAKIVNYPLHRLIINILLLENCLPFLILKEKLSYIKEHKKTSKKSLNSMGIYFITKR